MCASNCECNCMSSPITMYCSLPSPYLTQCFDSICKRNGTCCELQIISSSSQIVICNSTSLTQTIATCKLEDLNKCTTSSVVSKIMTSIKTSITTFFQTSSFTQTTSSTYSSVKSEKRPSSYVSTLSTSFNIVQSIIDTNQRNAGTNTSTIVTISVTVVVLSIILILIVIFIIFSIVMIVKRRNQFKPSKCSIHYYLCIQVHLFHPLSLPHPSLSPPLSLYPPSLYSLSLSHSCTCKCVIHYYATTVQ